MSMAQREQEASGTLDDARVRRRLAAILAADVKNYGLLMDGNEDDTHHRVSVEMDRLVQAIERSSGTVFSFAGDGLMAEFPSAVEAMRCALRVQAEAGMRAAGLPPEKRIEYRIGIHSGEVLAQKGHTGGNAVNIAARLEQIAEPGGIFLSEAVYDQVCHVIHANFDRVGQPNLKHLRDPVAVFAVSPASCRAWAGMPTFSGAIVGSSIRAEPRASIAVMPLRLFQDDPDDSALGAEIVDDVVHMLGGLSDQIVLMRGSAPSAARSPIDFRRVRSEMNVRYVLHGSIRRSRERTRVAIELNEAASGRVLWSDRFEGDTAELRNTPETLANRIGAGVAPRVWDQELAEIRHRHADNHTAYDLSMLALDGLIRLSRSSCSSAEGLLLRALERDPGYSPALSYQAWWHMIQVSQGWSDDPARSTAAAEAAARRAVDLDPNGALALAMLGHIHAHLLRDYRAAERLIERSLGSGTTNPWVLTLGSLTRGFLGDGAAAVELATKAVSLWPYGATASLLEHVMLFACYVAERFEEAASWGRMSAAHNSGNASTLRMLIATLVVLGRLEEARSYAQLLLGVDPGFRLTRFRRLTPLDDQSGDQMAQRLRMAGLPD